MKLFLLLAYLIFGFPTCVYAETYRDIGSMDTLGELKKKFPTANISKQNPAWAQKTDALYQISGEGMSGVIVVKFYDKRPYLQELLMRAGDSLDPSVKEKTENLINQTEEEAITVEWVRWVPDYPIPVTRFVSKYGKPDKSGFADENLQPYRSWEKKGLTAYLTDNEKNVVRVDFEFTKSEQRAAYLKKGMTPPAWLQESKPTRK